MTSEEYRPESDGEPASRNAQKNEKRFKVQCKNKEKEQVSLSPSPLALGLEPLPLALQRFHQLHLVIQGDFGDGVEVAHPKFDGGEGIKSSLSLDILQS